MISAVRESLRDLVEMTLASMLLNGQAIRDRDDYTELGMRLVTVFSILMTFLTLIVCRS